MPLFERRIGDHVAERVYPAPDSPEEARLSVLADEGVENWVRVTAAAEDDGPPNRTAGKGAWTAYAVRHGVSEADAKAMTRDQLADKFLGPAGE